MPQTILYPRRQEHLHHHRNENQRLPRETEAATEDCVGNWKNSPLRLKQDDGDHQDDGDPDNNGG